MSRRPWRFPPPACGEPIAVHSRLRDASGPRGKSEGTVRRKPVPESLSRRPSATLTAVWTSQIAMRQDRKAARALLVGADGGAFLGAERERFARVGRLAGVAGAGLGRDREWEAVGIGALAAADDDVAAAAVAVEAEAALERRPAGGRAPLRRWRAARRAGRRRRARAADQPVRRSIAVRPWRTCLPPRSGGKWAGSGPRAALDFAGRSSIAAATSRRMIDHMVSASHVLDRVLVLEMVRVTEAAAVAASKLIGRGDEKAADHAAVEAMRAALNTLEMDGTVVIGEGERDEAPMLYHRREGRRGAGDRAEDRHRPRSARGDDDHRQGGRRTRSPCWRSRRKAASSTRPTSIWRSSRSGRAMRRG